MQYLTGLVANHVDNSYYRITINTGNYREKREKNPGKPGQKDGHQGGENRKKQLFGAYEPL